MYPIQMRLLTRPKQTRSMIETFIVSDYTHKIESIGGFDSASCKLFMPFARALKFFNSYVANIVEFMVLNPQVPIWEGYIDRITLTSGDLQITRSVSEMYNRVQVTYDLNGGGTASTAVTDNLTSQNIYGVKCGAVDGTINMDGANITHKNGLRSLIKNIMSYPQTSVIKKGQAEAGATLQLDCLGLHCFAFDWVNYNEAGGVTAAPNTVIDNAITTSSINAGNAPAILQTTGTGYNALIQTNSGYTFPYKHTGGGSIWQLFQSIAEAGDGAFSRWVIGITPYDRNRQNRRLYYRPANTTVKYLSTMDNGNVIRTTDGVVIHPWEFRPDAGLRIIDAFPPAISARGDDPRLNYVKTVTFDANSNSVVWQSDDDMSTEGALQLNRYHKMTNKKVGAPARQRL